MERKPNNINREGLTVHRAWGEIDDPTLQTQISKNLPAENSIETQPVLSEIPTTSWGREADAQGLSSQRQWLASDDPSI